MSDAAEVRALIGREAKHALSKILGWARLNPERDYSPEWNAAIEEFATTVADALEAAQTPATDDEREALKTALTHCYWQRTGYRVTWEHIGPLMDAILAAGFRRSARVPVSRDELARFIGQWMADDHNGFGSCNAPRDMAGDILATHDIFPKADRKPADSSNGDDRG